ncbi:hypothetical protein M9H77_35521 [Catharanthus roseus]|uniref:Uncharacterized protein n=1 Tax=Catharanthus roseus TaxID=4058 RepID=A0ACB9ZQI3_CATRO|nr:hypothetical protein M9H77_35521 [Catharanthus roseus]
MEAMRKQENYQSKLARDMYNCYHGSGNGVNAYDGSNHGHGNFIFRGHHGYGNFTPKRHNNIGNFSSYAKSYEHTPYDDYVGYERVNIKYVEHSPYGVTKVEPLTLSIVDELPRTKELPKAKIEKSLETHVEKETSNEDNCINMNEKSIEKEE